MYQIKRLFLFISILGYFGVTQAHAEVAVFGNLYKDSTISFGAPVPEKPLQADGLRLFVWNIHKAEDPRLSDDFADLAFGADIALFQEFVSNKSFIDSLSAANPELGWTMAKSFQMSDFNFTGVGTGARVKPLREEVIVSNVTEPITETPKTILLSEFTIENSLETLLIANFHGINFVSLDSYKVQVDQLVDVIRSHQGPMIVAGDFNTWDTARFVYLQKVFGPLGLSKVKTPLTGIFYLDHIFIRGMKPRFVFDLSHIDSSDHAPLMVDLIYETNKVMMYEAQ